ncbi:cuticle protein 19.8 [Ischnura elegans]|uniref:cuticle protein 19.8 n=1 Tax=Ischnura elegans TaxID=197161 RepID=UPI001ED8B8FF|nr:cuticle protein 19.8 [Ischnura elegans]
MYIKVATFVLPWLALASAVSLTQQQQQQLAYAAASQQQAQQFQPQPQYFAAVAPGHGQFDQRATIAAYQPAPAAYQPQPRPVPISPQQYQQIPQQPARKVPRPINPNAQQPLQEEDYDPNPAYNFSFDVKDDTFTNYQNRKEQREGDKISGSYSVVDSDGFIRTVTYTADPLQGFKAEVVREPTDIVVKLPTPAPQTATRIASVPNGAFASHAPAPQPQRAQPQYVAIPSPAPQLRQRPQEPAPQYVQAVPQQYTLARQPQQLQQAHLLQAAYRPSSAKAAPRVGVPVAGGILYQQQHQLPQQYQQ